MTNRDLHDYPDYPDFDIEHDVYTPRKHLPIPDLRFEQVYLKRIQDCIHIAPQPAVCDVQDTEFTTYTHATPLIISSQQVVRMDWGKIVYITLRDQVMMPLLQGMLWGIVGTYYSPFVAYARGSLHAGVAKALPVEGGGVRWLRGWLKRSGFSSITVGPPSL